MDSTEQNTDVLVIGAGMAGLTAAAELQRAGLRVVILDKSRSVGGRLASRRIDGATFDHGAQFITTRDPRFAAVLEQTLQNGALKEWCRGFSGREDGHARWCGIPSMSAVPKHLATGLELELEVAVSSLQVSKSRWHAETDTGATYSSAAVLLTPPVPQSLALLNAGGVLLAPELQNRLGAIEYERCLAVMAVLGGPSRIPPPGALSLNEGPIAWIADNQIKATVSGRPKHLYSIYQKMIVRGKDFDDIYDLIGVRILVDKKSLLYLIGTTLEYSGGLNGKGFAFNNPNANRTCGCGESFAV